MLHTKYQGARHCRFRQDDLFMFSQYKSKAEGNSEIDTIKYLNWLETQYGKVNTIHKRANGSAISQQVTTCLCKICHLPECAIYTTGLLFAKILWRSTRLCYKSTIKTLGIVVSNKNIFSLKIYFSPCDLDMHGLNYFNNYLRGSYRNHSCKVWLKSR